MKGLEEKLNIARKELLDLSFRNPLINFKLKKSSGLLFENIDYYSLYEHLVVDGKTSTFTKEPSTKPSRLTVLLDDSEIHKRVNRTYRNSKLFVEEKGANALFLAIGFLDWMEDDVMYRSPLVLVPVDLKKQLGKEIYQLNYNYEEIKLNDSLVEKLKNTFNVDLSYEYEEFDIVRYFHFIKSNIINSWHIVEDVAALDFFSYAKYMMYQFLDYKNWVNNGNIVNNDMMDKLFFNGFKEGTDTKAVDINEIEAPNKFYHVVDADSSQAFAINDINNGMSLVLQGPPGTGKSQTIVNIISNSVARGKSILFVAEKKAALDVVYQRLKRVGLDELAIEIHSDKTNKNDFLKALDKTLSLGEPKISDNTELFNKYQGLKEDLNNYKNIVNFELFDSKKSLVEIYGILLNMKEILDNEGVRLPRISFNNIDKWTKNDYDKRIDLVKELSDILKNIKKVEKHPFYGSSLDSCLPYEQVSYKEKLIDLEDSISLIIKLANEMSSLVGNKGNNSMFECTRFIKSIEFASNFIDVSDINVASYAFINEADKLLKLLNLACEIKEFEANNEYNIYFDMDFIKNYEICYKSKEKRIVKNEAYNKIINYVPIKDQKKHLTNLYNHMIKKLELNNNMTLLQSLYNNFSLDLDIDMLISKTNKIIDMHKRIENYELILQTKFLINDKAKLEKLKSLINDYNQALNDFISSKKLFMESIKYDEMLVFGYEKWYLDMPLQDIKKMVNSWINNIDRIVEIVRYNSLLDKFKRYDIFEIINISKEFKYDFEYLSYILSFEYYDSLVNRAYDTYPELVDFKKFKAERKIDLFKQYDISIMIENIKEILYRHYNQMPKLDSDSKMMNILRREFQKKRNQMPIKKLIKKCDELTKIKPVFMMSPLSVATYLTPGALTFDLVIFDEASQVRPVEAFAPLLMGKQIVVVGDSKQLPPTTFFDTMTNKYDELTDEDYDMSNMESILSLLLSKNIKERTLKWHYRSRHQSLIALSNQEFYDSNLLVFPSSNDLDKEEGLVFRHIPNSVYLRGGYRSNPVEARMVIEEAFKQMIENPNQTLGIAAFSMAQADELYREFERQLKIKKTKEIEEFLYEGKAEPFFIKNLENVQGDERDVILISVGYGRDKEGNLSMDFGPLNKDGGERRLNVLITRARKKCIVFSNITSYDINPSKTQAKGVIALKKFLEYAQTRGKYTMNDSSYSNEFTSYLFEKLISYGYNVTQNVGCSGNTIDLAIVDPNNPDRYILGIECDSGTYGMLESTIDRERIRKNVLKNLGWKIYHIWSCDYFRNPKVEFEKLLSYIDSIKDNKEDLNDDYDIIIKRAKVKPKKEIEYSVPYKVYSSHKRRTSILDEVDTLKVLIESIILVEAPINVNILKKRILGLLDVSKLSEKGKRNIDQALELLDCDKYQFKDSFYYNTESSIIIRNRSELDNIQKKIENISYDEIKLATFTAIDKGLASQYDEIKQEVSILLGVSKTEKLILCVNKALDELINEDRLIKEEELFYINDSQC